MDEAAADSRPASDRRHRLGAGVVGAGEIGRAADHFRQRRDQASSASSEALRGRDLLRRSFASFALHAATRVVKRLRGQTRRSCGARIRRACRRRARRGACPSRRARAWPCAGVAPGGENVGGNLERRRGPAERRARAFDFVGAERRAVRLSRAGLGRRAEADGRLAGDQRRLVGRLRLGRARRRSPPWSWPSMRVAFQPARLETLHLIDASRPATAGRRSKCRCRRTARSAC